MIGQNVLTICLLKWHVNRLAARSNPVLILIL
jgi:hypothetical protein